jgi:hypothetical protein
VSIPTVGSSADGQTVDGTGVGPMNIARAQEQSVFAFNLQPVRVVTSPDTDDTAQRILRWKFLNQSRMLTTAKQADEIRRLVATELELQKTIARAQEEKDRAIAHALDEQRAKSIINHANALRDQQGKPDEGVLILDRMLEL